MRVEKKFMQSKEDDSKKIEKKEEKFTQTKDRVKITFRQNRTFNLHLGRDVIIFSGRETKEIDRSLLSHKDFTDAIKEYFVIHK